MSDEAESIRIQLARMEGKQDVTNERLETANRINDERHAAVTARLNSHGERISGLEKREVGRDGERKGFALSGRAFLILCGAIPVGLIAALLRMLGA